MATNLVKTRVKGTSNLVARSWTTTKGERRTRYYIRFRDWKGVDLFTVGKLLGHKTNQQTQRYAHLAPDHMHSAVEQTARVLFALEVPRHMPHEAIAAA
jgi:integrase